MIKHANISLLVLLILFLLFSCKTEKNKDHIGLELVRFEKLLMELDTTTIKQSVEELENQYPEFSTIYFSEVLPIPGYEIKNDTFYQNLAGFVGDKKIREVYKMVTDQYPDFDEELEAIYEAVEMAKRFFPDATEPRIYTFISEFSYQRFLFDDADREGLAIGLDLFLEDQFDYSMLESPTNAFSKYLTRTYDQEHLVKKTVESWIEDKMGMVMGDRLIDHMIFNGTKLYILENVLNAPDSIITEYTQQQLEWIKANEKEMWSFYFQNDWFYSTDQYIIKRLVEPAPNSMALKMPSSAPGQTGNYLGYRIVSSYFKRFPETTIESFLKSDPQKILEKSKFKPGF